ncbi:hypothetical protein ACFE04_003125 [Oxalis oulophora]
MNFFPLRENPLILGNSGGSAQEKLRTRKPRRFSILSATMPHHSTRPSEFMKPKKSSFDIKCFDIKCFDPQSASRYLGFQLRRLLLRLDIDCVPATISESTPT